jgi:hypothetical protein
VTQTEAAHIFTEDLYQLNRKAVVLIPAPWPALLPEHLALLNKILHSVKLTLDGVQVFSCNAITIEALQCYNPSFILSFGSTLSSPVKAYSSETVNGIKVVYADALEQLDDAKKKNLWAALKEAFAL